MANDHQQSPEFRAGGPGTVDKGGGHATTIIINARPYEVQAKEISFEEVVSLAYNNAPPSGQYVTITVTYSRGENGKEGSMLPGDSVKVKHKMVFDVSATDRS
jgi:hypothetical protein